MTEPLTVDTVVDAYIKLRTRKGQVKKQADEEIGKLDQQMNLMESWLMQQADAQGVTSFRTPSGTAYVQTVDFASVADWDAVLQYVRNNNAYDLLEKRVSKMAVKQYLEATNQVPAGVNYSSRLEVNVRKPSAKMDD